MHHPLTFLMGVTAELVVGGPACVLVAALLVRGAVAALIGGRLW
jgi:hypothetical protein